MYSMNPNNDFLTGDPSSDHIEIGAISKKRRDRQKLFTSLPQATQELLIPKPSFFDGSSEKAEN